MAQLLLTVTTLMIAALLSPGPNFVLITGRALSSGARSASAAALGVSAGSLTHAVFGVAGFGALLQTSTRVFTAAKLAGAAYLMWIGYKSLRGALRSRRSASEGNAVAHANNARTVSPRRSMIDGYLTQMSNPKSTLFFLAMFTTVIPPDIRFWQSTAVVATVGVVALAGYLMMALLLSRSIFQQFYRRVSTGFDALFGVLMIGLGIRVGLGDR